MENRVDLPFREQIKREAKRQFSTHRGACIGVLFAMGLLSGALALLTSVMQETLGADGSFGSVLVSLVVLALSLFAATLGIEVFYFYLRTYRGERPAVGDFFAGITQDVGRKIKGVIWQGLFLFLWLLPVMLPLALFALWAGNQPLNTFDPLMPIIVIACMVILVYVVAIIKSLSYAMYFYILRDCPQVSVRDGLRLSIRMMKGNKGKLFMLYLSFFGWLLLGALPIVLVGTMAPESAGLLTLGIIASVLIMYCFVTPYMYTAQAGFYDALKQASIAAGTISEAEFGPNPVRERERE